MSSVDPAVVRRQLSQAQKLAAQGLCTCRSCKQTLKLTDAVATFTQRTLVFAVCWACLAAGRRVVMRRCPTGIEVLLEGGDGPLIAVPGGVGPGVQGAAPAVVKKELGG